MKWLIQDDKIIFSPEFNELLNPELLSRYQTLIFSNYELNDNFPNKLSFCDNKFNQSVDNLPNSIINLTFGSNFNQPVDNLPNSIINLTFGWKFNQPVDNLPNSVINLTFGSDFNQTMKKLPQNLKKIIFQNRNYYLEKIKCQTKHIEIIYE